MASVHSLDEGGTSFVPSIEEILSACPPFRDEESEEALNLPGRKVPHEQEYSQASYFLSSLESSKACLDGYGTMPNLVNGELKSLVAKVADEELLQAESGSFLLSQLHHATVIKEAKAGTGVEAGSSRYSLGQREEKFSRREDVAPSAVDV